MSLQARHVGYALRLPREAQARHIGSAPRLPKEA